MTTEPDTRYQSTDQPPNADTYAEVLPPDAPIPKEPLIQHTPELTPVTRNYPALGGDAPEVNEATPGEVAAIDSTDSNFPKLDGKTHINVYSRGNTELGRLLAHFTFSPFVHPYYGPFNSMEGFWYYIKARKPDDTLRTLAGHDAKEYGKNLEHIRRPNFKELIVEANFHKVNQNERLRDLMKRSMLPFDHYYIFGPGKILVRPKGFEWLVQGFEDIRAMIKAGTQPAPIEHRPAGRK